MDKKSRPIHMLSTRDPSQIKQYTQTESKGIEKYISCKWKWKKKAGVAIAISDKIDFKTKTVIRDKEGCYIIIKGSIHKEDITLVNTYAPDIGASTYLKQYWLT